jgi:site-specific DNA-methyltransferase (adenine-specific)
MTYTLHTGDCRDVMATLPAESVDAIVCDPPYGLSFMGKGWDYGVPGVDFWVEALRVLKPGGHLIAFGGTRTYHRLAVAIEDAGFEVRDCLMWLYGSGFPKSHDVSKAIDKQAGAEREVVGTWKPTGTAAVKIKGGGHANAGVRGEVEEIRQSINITAPNTDLAKEWHGWGTALKPAYEPAILARKPLRGTVADNVAQWGVGGLNIDGCRVPSDDGFEKAWDKPVHTNIANGGGAYGTGESSKRGTRAVDISANKPTGGRWPANVILDEEAAAALDAQSGERASGGQGRRRESSGLFGLGGDSGLNVWHGGTGGASRFFYTAKASRSEREAGLDGVELKLGGSLDGGNDTRNGSDKPQLTMRANHHPTVKPIALMRYMIRLVAPRGAVVLDPFMGSGSTGCAAMVEGMQFIGIDITPEYVDIARRRLAWWSCSLDNTATMESHEEDEA